jgi:putative transposase
MRSCDRLTQARLRRPVELAQCLSIRYTERLAEAGIEPSVGSAGDSHDNALAESIIGLYKTEEIRRRGPWKGVEEVEFATLEWVAWSRHAALAGAARVCSPGRVRAGLLSSAYYRHQTAPAELATLT